MTLLLPYLVVIGLLPLALPPALRDRSLKRFIAALLLSVVGVVVPLFVFFLSALLLPEWKGGCRHGWVDGFHLGKLALTPLVLWATAALYVSDVLRATRPLKPWVQSGLLVGASVSSVCLLFGVTTVELHRPEAGFLLVPLYVCLWYCVRAAQCIRGGGDPRSLGKALTGSAPFWIGSLLWSYSTYASLPAEPPECFIVTAAGRGHRGLVGPFFEVEHRGGARRANRQLATLWRFEALWQARAPASHACFRRVYDRLGPVIARRVTSPWRADAVYLAMRPVELIAGLCLGHAARSSLRASRSTGR